VREKWDAVEWWIISGGKIWGMVSESGFLGFSMAQVADLRQRGHIFY
jgi:hypothetical protein